MTHLNVRANTPHAPTLENRNPTIQELPMYTKKFHTESLDWLPSGIDGVYPPCLHVGQVSQIDRRVDSSFARV
jgi:hypothetical protein